MCYVKCQNILVNVLVYLLEHLSFWHRCHSFLLSKFASQLKLIQSVVRVGILQCSGSYSQDSGSQGRNSQVLATHSRVQGVRVPVPWSWVSGSRVPESQVSGSQGPRSQVSQDPGSQGPKVSGPRSRVSGPDFRLCRFLWHFLRLLIFFRAGSAAKQLAGVP